MTTDLTWLCMHRCNYGIRTQSDHVLLWSMLCQLRLHCDVWAYVQTSAWNASAVRLGLDPGSGGDV
jgi:hypothetical protein